MAVRAGNGDDAMSTREREIPSHFDDGRRSTLIKLTCKNSRLRFNLNSYSNTTVFIELSTNIYYGNTVNAF